MTTSSAALARALAEAGLAATIDVRGTLAVVTPGDGTLAVVAGRRAEIVRLAREHGFTHVAVELPRPPAR